MSIIKNIVELHQGRIWFESQENQGSTFFIEVPKNKNKKGIVTLIIFLQPS
ncbi:ATP-binding protein [Adhaeribacter pallidiroseus]|uniref:ATP-binding protein n=1 Tax=Adhaeribacter pallidiroseus TaxID=2072847 RepID=UPI000E1C1033